MTYAIKSYGLTDVGHVRENNEDVFAMKPELRLFVLADGMGGHLAGEIAAELAVQTVCDQIQSMVQNPKSSLSFDETHGMVNLAIEQANTAVYEKSLTDIELEGMGTTLCALYFHPQGLIYGHVGDSRIYRLRDGKLEQLTTDHSLVRQLVDSGHLTPYETEECGFKNIITKAIGTEPHIDPSVHMSDVMQGDVYIMCTDGLTDMLAQDEIEKIANTYEHIEEITEALISSAKERGGHDNITVVIAQVV